jgi:F-type H+-transporting ATPase subunit b
VHVFAAIGDIARSAAATPVAAETGGFTINLFWIIVVAANFIFFAAVLTRFALKPLSAMLATRQARVEKGLRDAEAALAAKANAEAERLTAINDARREARDILDRAQKVAQETRDADIAATRAELDLMRERATADIEAEKTRALQDLRAEVADLALAAAGRVVGETMSDARQRRLVEEFIAGQPGGGGNG